LALTVLAAAMLCKAGAVNAQSFGDCHSDAYWRSFGRDAGSDATFGCTELSRHTVQTGNGPRTVRVIQGFNADWSTFRRLPALAADGVEAFTVALGRLGPDFAMDNVTVLLADELPPIRDRGAGIGRAATLAQVHPPENGECRVAVYPL
jgi:hypothetical protein